MKRILLAFSLLGGSLLADTLVLTDGTRYTGTFLGGTARSITFMQRDTGTRQSYDIRNVREVMFGTNTASVFGSDPYYNGNTTNTTADHDRETLLRRLQDGVVTAMNNNNLSSAQRRMLNNSLMTLRTALNTQVNSEDYSNLRDLRRAVEDIRYVANSGALRAEDRNNLLDTIDQLRDQWQSRRRTDDVFGTRSRER